MREKKTFWEIEFFPPMGERRSPQSILRSFTVEERATIKDKLDQIKIIQNHLDWPDAKSYRHNGELLYQIRAGSLRIFYIFNMRTVVILHINKKKGQKARNSDKDRALRNKKEYEQRVSE